MIEDTETQEHKLMVAARGQCEMGVAKRFKELSKEIDEEVYQDMMKGCSESA